MKRQRILHSRWNRKKTNTAAAASEVRKDENISVDPYRRFRTSARMLAACLVPALKERNYTISTVESCTGGMIAETITSVPGSSSVIREAFVTYCDAAKHELAGVKRRTLQNYTAVSAQTAQEMAEGGARNAKADICLSVTGFAGPPSGDPSEEVGLVFVGCTCLGRTTVMKCRFDGDRDTIRAAACEQALLMVSRTLNGVKPL